MIHVFLPFYDEVDLLALQVHGASGRDVQFTVVESEWTYTQQPKPLYSQTRSWPDNVRFIRYTPRGASDWYVERDQRDECWRVMQSQLNDDDVVVLLDADEIIWNAETVWDARLNSWDVLGYLARLHGFIRLEMWNHEHGIDLWSPHPTLRRILRPIACTVRFLRSHGWTPAALRFRDPQDEYTFHAGHHFSYLMTPERIAEKLAAVAHQEYNKPPFNEPAYIAEKIAKGEDVFQRVPGRVWWPQPIVPAEYPSGMFEPSGELKPEWKKWSAL